MYHTSYIFDLDNTLIDTTAKVIVYEGGKVVGRVDSQYYNRINEIPSIPERHYDFSEFNSLSKLISEDWISPEQKQLFKICAIHHPQSTYICTARSNPEIISLWLKHNGIEIPLQNIACKFPNESTSQWKYNVTRYIARISDKIYAWEDDKVFIERMKLAAFHQETPIIFNCTDLRKFT